MSSLPQLLAEHRNILVIDAASMIVQIGLLGANRPDQWRTSAEEAGRGIFTCAKNILLGAGLELNEIDAFIFCEGPGSMLGIRTAAMALRTWQVLKPRSIFAYQSLAVAGHSEWMQTGPREFAVIADARRDTWHCQPFHANGVRAQLQRVSAAQLPEEELVTLEHFRTWTKTPRTTATCSYDLARIFPTLNAGDFFRETDTPDAFQYEAPEYKKWAAQIHSLSTLDKK